MKNRCSKSNGSSNASGGAPQPLRLELRLVALVLQRDFENSCSLKESLERATNKSELRIFLGTVQRLVDARALRLTLTFNGEHSELAVDPGDWNPSGPPDTTAHREDQTA